MGFLARAGQEFHPLSPSMTPLFLHASLFWLNPALGHLSATEVRDQPTSFPHVTCTQPFPLPPACLQVFPTSPNSNRMRTKFQKLWTLSPLHARDPLASLANTWRAACLLKEQLNGSCPLSYQLAVLEHFGSPWLLSLVTSLPLRAGEFTQADGAPTADKALFWAPVKC